jgi:hypothetical protein
MRVIKRIAISLAAFGFAIVVLNFVVVDLLVRYEVWSTGAGSRAALGRDLGLPILLGFAGIPAILGGAAITGGIAWAMTRRLAR